MDLREYRSEHAVYTGGNDILDRPFTGQSAGKLSGNDCLKQPRGHDSSLDGYELTGQWLRIVSYSRLAADSFVRKSTAPASVMANLT